MPRRASLFLDRVAIALSGLCLLHCVAGLALVALFAVGGNWLDHRVHLVGLGFALPLAAVALWRGWRQHGRSAIGLLGMAGLLVMAASLMVSHGGVVEVLVSMAGVTLLALAHWRNMQALRVA